MPKGTLPRHFPCSLLAQRSLPKTHPKWPLPALKQAITMAKALWQEIKGTDPSCTDKLAGGSRKMDSLRSLSLIVLPPWGHADPELMPGAALCCTGILSNGSSDMGANTASKHNIFQMGVMLVFVGLLDEYPFLTMNRMNQKCFIFKEGTKCRASLLAECL